MPDQPMMTIWNDRDLAMPRPRPCADRAYLSEPFVLALQDVRDGIGRGEPLVVITGASGTGKTLLCRALLETADPRAFTSFIVEPCESPEGLLVQVLSDFGAVDSAARLTRDEATRVLQRFLGTLVPLRARAVIVIDEAHRLQPDVAETLRVISTFESHGRPLLQVVLAGLPELEARLQRPDMRRIAQRVSRHVLLAPLGAHEIAGYVEHRLSFASGTGAGWQEHVIGRAPRGRGAIVTVQVPAAGAMDLSNIWFTPAAIRKIDRASGRIPAAIDALFDRAVQISLERRSSNIDARVIGEAARRVGRLSRRRAPRMWVRAAVAAAAIVTLVTSAAVAWARVGRTDSAATKMARVHGTSSPMTPGDDGAAPAQAPVALFSSQRMTATPGQTADSVTISVASFRTEQRARSVAAQLVDAGFPAFVRPRGDGLWQQVIVGPYVSREEAAAAQRAMAAQGVAGTEVRLERTELQP